MGGRKRGKNGKERQREKRRNGGMEKERGKSGRLLRPTFADFELVLFYVCKTCIFVVGRCIVLSQERPQHGIVWTTFSAL